MNLLTIILGYTTEHRTRSMCLAEVSFFFFPTVLCQHFACEPFYTHDISHATCTVYPKEAQAQTDRYSILNIAVLTDDYYVQNIGVVV